VSREPIIAVALLTQAELQALGSSFDRAWPINDAPCFQGLLQAIDEADRELWRSRDAAQECSPIELPTSS
jgi:hypothetical protein